jgi:putative glycosyltransferase (TIGR04372 family)
LIGYSSPHSDEDRFRAACKEALSEEFWYGPDATGTLQWTAPLGAAVERAWKDAGRGPLLHIAEDEHISTRKVLAQIFGLPEDAWFVGLHVREPGFHAEWHKKHPGTRHAEIETYAKAIDYVISRGGWVVRLGDQTMRPIKPHPRVIDYAVSPYRNFELDVYLCGACKYFIGTNSGLSIVPPLFGTRCVLTNWSPLAQPNWFLDDIYIPKLIRDVKRNDYAGVQQLFDTRLAWSEWQRDFKEDVFAIEDNSADDILDAVKDLHEEIVEGKRPTPAQQALADRFHAIAVANGSYIGSRIGARFVEKYQHLLDR